MVDEAAETGTSQLGTEDYLAAPLDEARPDSVRYQHSRGKLTARERVTLLTDPGSFVEFGALARPADPGADGMPVHADGILTGTARIDGRPAVVLASDFTAAGGSNGALGNVKMFRCWDIAADHGIPVVMLLEGGGHRIQEGLDSRDFAFGVDSPVRQAQLSGWVPMVAAVLGPGFAGPTLLAGMCDFVVGVDGMSTLGIAPPLLVRHATGEEVDKDELGGAAAQAMRSGLVDLVAANENEAVNAIRAFLSFMPSNASADPPAGVRRDPDYEAAARLDGIVPADLKRPYDTRDVVAGLADCDSIFEVKPTFAENIVTTFARIEGRRVGIIANQPLVRAGALDSDACEKASHFIALCDAFGIALIFLVDVPGFLVGTDAERTNLGRRSAKMLWELGQSTVPRYTVVLRKGYGAAYIAMSGGRSFGPELALAWPTAETAAMAVETAVEIAYRRQLDASADRPNAKSDIIDDIRSRLTAERAAHGFGFDAVVRPSGTRAMLAESLQHAPKRRLRRASTPRFRPVSPI